MALTRPFIDTIKARADRDPAFRGELLQEAVSLLLAGDMAAGKAMLRDYVNATIGFQTLGRQLDRSPKTLMRMLSGDGNPRADNLFALLRALQKAEGMDLVATPRLAGRSKAA